MFTDKTNSRGGGLGGVRVRASERAHFPSDAPSSPWLRKPVSLAYYHIFLSHTIKQIILCCFHCPALVLVPLFYDASFVLNLDEGGSGAHLELCLYTVYIPLYTMLLVLFSILTKGDEARTLISVYIYIYTVPLYYDASVVLNLDEGGRGAHLELRAHPQLTVIHPDQDPTKVGALQPQPTALWHQY